jgi:hypothetical protein
MQKFEIQLLQGFQNPMEQERTSITDVSSFLLSALSKALDRRHCDAIKSSQESAKAIGSTLRTFCSLCPSSFSSLGVDARDDWNKGRS